MKKLALFTILSIFAFTHKLQAQEPTKQETIDWIAEKFKLYLCTETVITRRDPFFIYWEYIDCKNGIITMRKRYCIEEPCWISYPKLNLNNIIKYSNYEFYGENLMEMHNERSHSWQTVYLTPQNTLGKKLDIPDYLFPRFEKAVLKLIEYNLAEKPKEKF